MCDSTTHPRYLTPAYPDHQRAGSEKTFFFKKNVFIFQVFVEIVYFPIGFCTFLFVVGLNSWESGHFVTSYRRFFPIQSQSCDFRSSCTADLTQHVCQSASLHDFCLFSPKEIQISRGVCCTCLCAIHEHSHSRLQLIQNIT